VEISPAPIANTASSFMPFNSVQTYKISPGDRVAALSNDSVAGTLTVTELSGGWFQRWATTVVPARST
jgi:hypothetical protein